MQILRKLSRGFAPFSGIDLVACFPRLYVALLCSTITSIHGFQASRSFDAPPAIVRRHLLLDASERE